VLTKSRVGTLSSCSCPRGSKVAVNNDQEARPMPERGLLISQPVHVPSGNIFIVRKDGCVTENKVGNFHSWDVRSGYLPMLEWTGHEFSLSGP